jgi:hypothetical protein
MKFKISLFVAALSVAPCFGQKVADYNIFMNSAREHATIFSGEYPMRFGHWKQWIPEDGSTFYAYSMDYETGNVIYKGKEYRDMLLNLNASSDELYIIDPKGGPVVVNKHYVGAFSLGGRQFIHVQNQDGGLKSGYYQVLYSGTLKLYKKIRKRYYEKTNNTRSMLRGFTLAEEFYLCHNGQWVQVGKKKEVQRLFPNQKYALDQWSQYDFRAQKERTLVAITTLLDNQ